ncbi:MAG: 50S ribosomal protein L11 methyltransferase, partial [Rhodothermales bacterium]|nr:50S ribosomal protein L11 methyltransferase [Rhodothermales bacterium]
SELGFESFLESESGLSAFIPSHYDGPDLRSRTSDVISEIGGSVAPVFRIIESRNWNEEWERSMQPVDVGQFLILPPWSEDSASGKIPLWIEPKMSFGTGHHESTRLALKFVERYASSGSRVLDVGTGTGILAIAAARLGASHVTAIDIDPWSAANCPENIDRNGMSDCIRFVYGDLGKIEEAGFDLILANINRVVLTESLPDLEKRLGSAGTMVLSGILQTDRDSMITRADELGLKVTEEAAEGEWWAVALSRRGKRDG